MIGKVELRGAEIILGDDGIWSCDGNPSLANLLNKVRPPHASGESQTGGVGGNLLRRVASDLGGQAVLEHKPSNAPVDAVY